MARSSRPHRDRGRTNLPRLLGSFVGRRSFLERLAELAVRGGRIVTVLGPPGMGKTRLAVRFAELHGEGWIAAGGVWFCDLTEARDGMDLCAAVARVVGLRLRPELGVVDAIEEVGRALAEAGPLLLVLDNFEQLADVAARTVEEWCAVAGETVMIVTSRVRLGLASEVVVDLSPLEVPTSQAPAAARACEAVQLYEERARAAGGWREGGDEIVAALVRALDGIPLAIELAAARSRLLGPADLLARLAQSRDVLADRPNTRTARHSTLRAAIDGSWALLTPVERSVLAQCSVFAGDWSLEAAEAVIEIADALDASSVIDVLGALQDKSLVRAVAGRISLYLSIRDYAAEHLSANRRAASALAERHRRYFIDATRTASEGLARTGDPAARAEVVREKENLLAVHRGLSQHAATRTLTVVEASDLAHLVLQLEPVLAAEASYEDLVAILSGAIAAANFAEDPVARGRLLVARGNARGLRGALVDALADIEAARDLGVAHDPVLEAEALVMASVRYRHQGRFDEARAASERALTLLERREQPRIEGAARAVLGLLLFELGDVVASRRENLRARAMFDAAGDRWSEALALANLAQLDQSAGDFERSAHAYDAALERFREHGDRRYESRYLGYRAGLDLEAGDWPAARATYETALEMLSALRIRHVEGLFRGCLGALECLEGDAEKALAQFDRAEALVATSDSPSIGAALDVHRGQLDWVLAREAASRGDAERARRLEASARRRHDDARLVESSEDVRFARRMLERALATAAPRPRSDAKREHLTMDHGARSFRVGEGAPVDLARRAALRRMLAVLAERHRSEPDVAMGTEALLAAGWPGERVIASAGATRVRVAIATLRRLGLARLIVTRDDGYLLDPRAQVDISSEV